MAHPSSAARRKSHDRTGHSRHHPGHDANGGGDNDNPDQGSRPRRPTVAGIHIVNNTWDISGRVANAIAPGDPLEQELQRGLWASITSEIKDFQCEENPEGTHANGETTVHCMINAAIWDPFYLVINAPVTITVDLEQDKRFPEPKVRRVTLEPRTISAIGEVYKLEVFQAKEDPANNWSR